ncbi:MAG: AAA family ATPase, partial [Promicromonosporaceae bacterium]|nr:AAA family ATPase [Promicromonosporaceae bacterium]
MQGGVRPFRGTGSDARRYVEADHCSADDYYLDGDATFAAWTCSGADGSVQATAELAPEQYAAWVDWTHPVTGQRMGVPRKPGDGKRGSPRFQEMIVNAPKSLSIAAALHLDLSKALDAAQADAADEMRRYLALHATTRVGPRGAQQVVPVEGLQTVAIVHHTSRAGDPHRHIHFQIGTRVWAQGAWRGLDGVALFKMQGALRAIGTAAIAAHPGLADTLAGHGLTLDPTTGEVIELERFNQAMSKRGLQVEANLAVLHAEWEASHPGETMSRTTSGRLHNLAWAQDRPSKKPTTLAGEAGWIAELREAGYDEATLRQAAPVPVAPIGTLSTRQIAARALDRCGSDQSAWTPHQIREHTAALVTETGVRASGEELRRFIDRAASLALAECQSVLPPGLPAPEHVAHLTSPRVIAAETRLRDLLTTLVPPGTPPLADVAALAATRGLDDGQARAAAAVASDDPLVIVEGAAGSGKTSMLAVAIAAIQRDHEGGYSSDSLAGLTRVLAPTRRAAQVAQAELGAPATSVAALIHAHGWRWNNDGVWARLTVGDTDPYTGRPYHGPPASARLARGERVIVDEAGMLDQDTTIALLTIIAEAGATVALVGDRAQLPAIGRGGVLDIAANVRGVTFDMTEVHRFTDPNYAALTIAMRDRDNPGNLFDQLAALGLIHLHTSEDEQREQIAAIARDGEPVTVATNEEAATLNQAIRARRIASGLVDDTVAVTGSDGLPIGKGDLIQTRRNDTSLGVANRQTWTVQRVQDGQVWVRPTDARRTTAASLVRLPAQYVNQWTHLSYAATAYG